MTLKELNDPEWLRPAVCSGRPSQDMSDSVWQAKFAILKMMVVPSKYPRMIGCGVKERIYWNDETWADYKGITNWQSYCQFINDTLIWLRRGSTEYAYFTYQIRDLLRFEHERLRTRYVPEEQWWEVWLDFGAEDTDMKKEGFYG